MSHYQHLNIEEREMLYLMHGQGKSFRKIADELGRAPSTITREYKRGRCWRNPYLPSRAQYRYEQRRKRCGRKRILEVPEYQQLVRRLIEEQQWSPEEISNRLRIEGHPLQISWISIYRAIWAGVFDGPKSHGNLPKKHRFSRRLRRKGKKHRKNGTEKKPGRYVITDHIEDRPEEGNARLCIGYYEADTVIGKRGGDSLLTLVDRRSRFTLAAKVPNLNAETIKNKFIELFRSLPEGAVKGVTPDRGREFAQYMKVVKAFPGVKFYFASPYSPWQRGTNENTNGLIREYLPKYQDMTDVSDAEVSNMIFKLNTRPRKCLGWNSPYEIFFQKVLHLT